MLYCIVYNAILYTYLLQSFTTIAYILDLLLFELIRKCCGFWNRNIIYPAYYAIKSSNHIIYQLREYYLSHILRILNASNYIMHIKCIEMSSECKMWYIVLNHFNTCMIQKNICDDINMWCDVLSCIMHILT